MSKQNGIVRELQQFVSQLLLSTGGKHRRHAPHKNWSPLTACKWANDAVFRFPVVFRFTVKDCIESRHRDRYPPLKRIARNLNGQMLQVFATPKIYSHYVSWCRSSAIFLVQCSSMIVLKSELDLATLYSLAYQICSATSPATPTSCPGRVKYISMAPNSNAELSYKEELDYFSRRGWDFLIWFSTNWTAWNVVAPWVSYVPSLCGYSRPVVLQHWQPNGRSTVSEFLLLVIPCHRRSS
jgi:hypothetical protein